jgi:hypothetical protein
MEFPVPYEEIEVGCFIPAKATEFCEMELLYHEGILTWYQIARQGILWFVIAGVSPHHNALPLVVGGLRIAISR